MFGGIPAKAYAGLFAYLTKRIVRVGMDGSGLVLMRSAASAAERLDALSSGIDDLREMLVNQTLSQLQRQQKSLVRMYKSADLGEAIRLVGESTADSLQGARAILSEAVEIAATTTGSLVAPSRSYKENSPPEVSEISHRGAIREYKLSWQAQALNLPLRFWLKQKMKNGEVKQLRAWARRAKCITTALSKKEHKKLIKFGSVRAEWVTPLPKSASRVLLYLPGGAFIIPAMPMHNAMIARLCEAIDARALLVHYRLAPEHPFPAGLDDCVAAYRHLLKQGVDPQRIVIAGDSAGGGLVLSTLLALRDAGDPLPASAVAISPLADLTYSGASRVYNRSRDPMLPTHRATQVTEIYLKDHAPEHPLVSPVYGDYTGLPPILVQVGSTEMLLDDSLKVAARARAQGVAVEVEVWHEMPHVWHLWKVLPESGLATNHIATFVRHHVPDLIGVEAA